jgi:hypothetical protein
MKIYVVRFLRKKQFRRTVWQRPIFHVDFEVGARAYQLQSLTPANTLTIHSIFPCQFWNGCGSILTPNYHTYQRSCHPFEESRPISSCSLNISSLRKLDEVAQYFYLVTHNDMWTIDLLSWSTVRSLLSHVPCKYGWTQCVTVSS